MLGAKKLYDPPPVDVPGEGDLYVEIQTRLGTLKGRLYEERAPKTVGNFVALVQGKATDTPYYDGIIFHRCIPNFMVQGGCPEGRGTGGPGYDIKDEFHPELRHDKPGIFSMANRGPNTGGGQFFITETPTPHLDNKHAVFGELVDGLEIVKAISKEPQDRSNRPNTPLVMDKVTVYRA